MQLPSPQIVHHQAVDFGHVLLLHLPHARQLRHVGHLGLCQQTRRLWPLPSSQTWCYYRLSVGCTLHTWIHEWIIMNKCIKKNQQINLHIYSTWIWIWLDSSPQNQPPIEHNSFPILPRADLVEFDGPGHGHSCPEVGEAHFDQLLGVQGAVPVALDLDQLKMGFTCGKRKKYGRKSLEIPGFQGIFMFFFMTFPPASELLRDFMGSRIPTSMNDGIVQDKSGWLKLWLRSSQNIRLKHESMLNTICQESAHTGTRKQSSALLQGCVKIYNHIFWKENP